MTCYTRIEAITGKVILGVQNWMQRVFPWGLYENGSRTI